MRGKGGQQLASGDELPVDSLQQVMPLAKTLGIETLVNTPNEVRARLSWAESLCTSGGVLHGGVIMALNYALFEEAIRDRQTGRQVNANMEFYKLGGIEDMPEIVVHMHDMPERGVIGIGEPPTISTAAAVGNAVFNALGVRVPQAPYTPERVLAALASRNR